MNINEQLYQSITELAALQFKPSEVAVMIGLTLNDADLFTRCCIDSSLNYDIYQAYHKGRLESEIKLRQSIFTAAEQGSPSAQAKAAQYVTKNKFDNKCIN